METATRHEDRVLEWRRDEFLRMGFDDTAAALLAHSNIDLHRTEDLLFHRNGNGKERTACTHEQAMRILMGTDFQGDDPTFTEHVAA